MLTSVSPLRGIVRPGRFGSAEGPPGLTLRPVEGLQLTAILRRGPAEGPEAPVAVRDGAATLVWTGPGAWLALGELEAGRFGETASLVDLTGARCLIRMEGPAVAEALSRLVPLDLHPRAFPPGAAAGTLAGHIAVLLWRDPRDGAWWLSCQRSFATSLWHDLTVAAAPFGYEVAHG